MLHTASLECDDRPEAESAPVAVASPDYQDGQNSDIGQLAVAHILVAHMIPGQTGWIHFVSGPESGNHGDRKSVV